MKIKSRHRFIGARNFFKKLIQGVKPFAVRQQTLDKKIINTESDSAEKWLLPYEHLEKHSQVALYGAGDVG